MVQIPPKFLPDSNSSQKVTISSLRSFQVLPPKRSTLHRLHVPREARASRAVQAECVTPSPFKRLSETGRYLWGLLFFSSP